MPSPSVRCHAPQAQLPDHLDLRTRSNSSPTGMTLRILHVIDTLGLGGAENLLRSSIEGMPEHDHTIVTLFSHCEPYKVPANSTHYCLNSTARGTLPFAARRYREIIKNFDPHIVHAHLYFSTVIAKSLTPRKTPLLFTLHSDFRDNARRWYYKALDRMVSNTYQTCIGVSKTVLLNYLKYTNFPGISIVLENHVDDSFFSIKPEAIRSYAGELRLVAVGNVKPVKNYGYLLEAFEYLKDLPVICDVFGGGPNVQSLNQAASERGLKVRFLGPIPDPSAILNNYHLYIMPSLSEGFGLSLFEAMAASLPPIVSDIAVFRELLGTVGNFMSLSDPRDLRKIVGIFLENPELLVTIGSDAKNLASKKASRSKYLSSLSSIYYERARAV